MGSPRCTLRLEHVERAVAVAPQHRPPRGEHALRTVAARPRASVWSQRSLIWNFAQRDLKSRFKGTPRLGSGLVADGAASPTLITYSLVCLGDIQGRPSARLR